MSAGCVSVCHKARPGGFLPADRLGGFWRRICLSAGEAEVESKEWQPTNEDGRGFRRRNGDLVGG